MSDHSHQHYDGNPARRNDRVGVEQTPNPLEQIGEFIGGLFGIPHQSSGSENSAMAHKTQHKTEHKSAHHKTEYKSGHESEPKPHQKPLRIDEEAKRINGLLEKSVANKLAGAAEKYSRSTDDWISAFDDPARRKQTVHDMNNARNQMKDIVGRYKQPELDAVLSETNNILKTKDLKIVDEHGRISLDSGSSDLETIIRSRQP